MLAALTRYIDAQSPDEVARQYRFLADTAKTRLVLTAISYVLAMMFLPFWLCFVLVHIDTLAEIICLRWMKAINPAQHRRRYVATHVCLVVAQISYMFAAASIWQLETPFARPFAIAMIAMSIVQLLTVRSIHLAYGFSGWMTLTVTSIWGVLALWTGDGGLQSGADHVMVLSLISVFTACAFVMSAMLSNHALHAGLVQGRTAARAADQAKGRFLAQMSHELRTPLNAIIGMGEAELAGAKTNAARNRMGVLVSSARGLALILDDILDMSAIGNDSMTIRPICADPAAEIGAITALFRQSYHLAGLTLGVDISPDVPATATFDAQRLRQCLTNLLSNALKFTAQGGADLRVDLAPDGALRLVIKDSGPGIAADLQKTIFHPFERGLTAQAGSGLGLSISRALARSMGGDLVLRPSDTGAEFCLTIAIVPVCVAVQLAPATRLPDLSRRRILVVDDIATNRLVAATYLQLWQASVVEAVGGAEAVAMIAADPPDLVLLDMNMPGLDGYQTLALIRGLAAPAAMVPVVAMTADVSVAQRPRYLKAGFDGYVAKPLIPEALTAALSPLLSRAKP